MAVQLIDSHQHVFWHGGDDHALIADMDANGIEKAWLMTWEEQLEAAGNPHYLRILDPRLKTKGSSASLIPLDTIIDVCSRFPDRFIPGYCPHPEDEYACSKLAAAVDIHGVRICGEWKFSMAFDDPRCLEIFKRAGDLRLPVVLHLDVAYLPPKGGAFVGAYKWKGGGIDNLLRALEACPETDFIGHAPGFWRELCGDADHRKTAYLQPPLMPGGRLPQVFDAHDNLYADLSAGSALRALLADPDHARAFIVRFEDRLLFGRDYYGGELLEFLNRLDLPETTWAKVGRENAERLLSGTETKRRSPSLQLAKTDALPTP